MRYFQITYNIKDSEDRHHRQHFVCTPAEDLEDAKRWAESERERYEEVHSVIPWENVTNPHEEHETW
jgi:hypothetical protein